MGEKKKFCKKKNKVRPREDGEEKKGYAHIVFKGTQIDSEVAKEI